jgi:hypothetical protein
MRRINALLVFLAVVPLLLFLVATLAFGCFQCHPPTPTLTAKPSPMLVLTGQFELIGPLIPPEWIALALVFGVVLFAALARRFGLWKLR